jgi:hypothetical protein
MYGICPRRSGRKWRESKSNHSLIGKQMTANASWPMRPTVAVRRSRTASGNWRVPPSGSRKWGAGQSIFRDWPYDGSSRMKGNFHVRFQGGCGWATTRTYPTNLFAKTVSLSSPAPCKSWTGLAHPEPGSLSPRPRCPGFEAFIPITSITFYVLLFMYHYSNWIRLCAVHDSQWP